jgi:hypothetical protein
MAEYSPHPLNHLFYLINQYYYLQISNIIEEGKR